MGWLGHQRQTHADRSSDRSRIAAREQNGAGRYSEISASTKPPRPRRRKYKYRSHGSDTISNEVRAAHAAPRTGCSVWLQACTLGWLQAHYSLCAGACHAPAVAAAARRWGLDDTLTTRSACEWQPHNQGVARACATAWVDRAPRLRGGVLHTPCHPACRL
jgi:hypothetical protein